MYLRLNILLEMKVSSTQNHVFFSNMKPLWASRAVYHSRLMAVFESRFINFAARALLKAFFRAVVMRTLEDINTAYGMNFNTPQGVNLQ